MIVSKKPQHAKTARLDVAMLADEYELVRLTAKATGRSIAQFMREAVWYYLTRPTVIPDSASIVDVDLCSGAPEAKVVVSCAVRPKVKQALAYRAKYLGITESRFAALLLRKGLFIRQEEELEEDKRRQGVKEALLKPIRDRQRGGY